MTSDVWSKGHFSFSTSILACQWEGLRGSAVGKGQSQDGWTKLSKGIFHTVHHHMNKTQRIVGSGTDVQLFHPMLLWLITCVRAHMDPQDLFCSLVHVHPLSGLISLSGLIFLQVLGNECLDRIMGMMMYIVWSFLFLVPLDGLSGFLEYSFLSAYAFPSRSTQLQKHLCLKSIWFCFVQCHEHRYLWAIWCRHLAVVLASAEQPHLAREK